MKLRSRDYPDSEKMEGENSGNPTGLEDMELGQSTPVGSIEVAESEINSQLRGSSERKLTRTERPRK